MYFSSYYSRNIERHNFDNKGDEELLNIEKKNETTTAIEKTY